VGAWRPEFRLSVSVSVLKNRFAVPNCRLREILRGFLPRISMVKATDAWKSHNFRAR
jgi:hypothetical protein